MCGCGILRVGVGCITEEKNLKKVLGECCVYAFLFECTYVCGGEVCVRACVGLYVREWCSK